MKQKDVQVGKKNGKIEDIVCPKKNRGVFKFCTEWFPQTKPLYRVWGKMKVWFLWDPNHQIYKTML